MVTQLIITPLRPLSLRYAFAVVKKRLRSVLWTTLLTSLLIIFGILLLLIPGIIFIILYSLTLPVVMMEGLSGRPAMRRAKNLAQRSMNSVVLITIIQFGIPFVATLCISFLLASGAWNYSIDPMLMRRISELIRTPFTLLTMPLISIMTTLLYLKMRDAGGESWRESLPQIDYNQDNLVEWQTRLH
jgi:hypothetical protein